MFGSICIPFFWPIQKYVPILKGSMSIVLEPLSGGGVSEKSNKAYLSTTLITLHLTKLEVVVRFNYPIFCVENVILTSNNCTAMNHADFHSIPTVIIFQAHGTPYRTLWSNVEPPKFSQRQQGGHKWTIQRRLVNMKVGAGWNTWKPQETHCRDSTLKPEAPIIDPEWLESMTGLNQVGLNLKSIP